MGRQRCAAPVSVIAVSIGGAVGVRMGNVGIITELRWIHTTKRTQTSHCEPAGVTGVPIRRTGARVEPFIQYITASIL